MKYTQKDKDALRQWRQKIDSDNIKIKEKVKEKLLANKDIIYVLDNKEFLEAEAEPDEYFNVNILPYQIISPIQADVKNYICFECNSTDELGKDNRLKRQQIVFTIFCEHSNIKESVTKLCRHDLLAALILEEFNWSTSFGGRLHCCADSYKVVDNSFACRVLVFEQVVANNLVKTIDGIPRQVDRDF